MTMLEYCKIILEKVSFDPVIFRSELIKAIRELVVADVAELKKWCIETFGWNYCSKAIPEFVVYY